MARRFRMTIEIEMPDGTTAKQAAGLVKERLAHPAARVPPRIRVQVMKAKVEDESPESGVQAAFIYDSGGHGACHAVVKKKNGPWSENRFGFCGMEPETGPVGSIDKPDGGLCSTCAKFVRKGEDGLWYVRENTPLPGPKSRATTDCGGCDDD
jgi:hypothetical protein